MAGRPLSRGGWLQAVARRLDWGGRFRLGRLFLLWFWLGVALSGAIAACSDGQDLTASTSAANAKPKQNIELALVSFAVTKDAYDVLIPKFVEQWKQQHGQTVFITQSYGGSGSQTRAVVDGLDADVVHLALALDTDKLVKSGLIEPGWEQEFPNGSIVSKSVAALITREGNPKNIQSFQDLAREDVQWITADPKTSGVARWNFLALWNAAMQAERDEAKAQDFVTTAYKNVPILTRDAREASDVFLHQGQGDALVNYENEVLLAQKRGETASYTIPAVNISIDNPVAVVDAAVDQRGTREVAEAFVRFLFTPEAQAEFAKVGFRPVVDTVAKEKAMLEKYPPVKTLATVQDYGGWNVVQKQFFADGALFDQIRQGRTD